MPNGSSEGEQRVVTEQASGYRDRDEFTDSDGELAVYQFRAAIQATTAPTFVHPSYTDSEW